MNPEFLLQIVLAICAGAGIYAAIRGDLARAITKAEQALVDSSKAHDRLDTHIENHRG